MAAPTVAEMLKYANLQMAAEALYTFDTKLNDPAALPPGSTTTLTALAGHYKGLIDPKWLTAGNEHATRFTAQEAANFAAQWEVVDHISSPSTVPASGRPSTAKPRPTSSPTGTATRAKTASSPNTTTSATPSAPTAKTAGR